MLTLYTFGDSILDCAHYNDAGATPGALLVKNDDRLFPEFRERDLSTHGQATLVHCARDGATMAQLSTQARHLRITSGQAIALVTVGGNDMIQGLARDSGAGISRFQRTLEDFITALPIRPVVLGNVYDPTGGDDARNFLGVDAKLARANLSRINLAIAEVAERHGHLADLHAHFRTGDASWFTSVIEPSLRGCSEVRRCFLPVVIAWARTLYSG